MSKRLMKILVADDNRSILFFLTAMLQEDGYDVTPVSNGQEAIDKFKSEIFDLVLMDIVMPILDGYEATKQIKKLAGNHFVPVIFLTATSDDASLAKCVEVGGDDFVVKPYNRVIMNAKIASFKRIQKLYNKLEHYNRQTEEELSIAHHIFDSVIKRNIDQVSGIDVYQSAMGHFNGDMLVYAKTQSDRIHIMLGDFTGHGLVAAVGAIPASDVFYQMARNDAHILQILLALNHKLKSVMPIGRYCATALISVNLKNQTAQIWNGGLPSILIVNNQTREITQIKSSKLPLGIVDNDSLDTSLEYICLEENQTILMYSDGLTELNNQAGEMLGADGLENIIKNSKPSHNLLDQVKSQLELYMTGKSQDDDISIVSLDIFRLLRNNQVVDNINFMI